MFPHSSRESQCRNLRAETPFLLCIHWCACLSGTHMGTWAHGHMGIVSTYCFLAGKNSKVQFKDHCTAALPRGFQSCIQLLSPVPVVFQDIGFLTTWYNSDISNPRKEPMVSFPPRCNPSSCVYENSFPGEKGGALLPGW